MCERFETITSTQLDKHPNPLELSEYPIHLLNGFATVIRRWFPLEDAGVLRDILDFKRSRRTAGFAEDDNLDHSLVSANFVRDNQLVELGVLSHGFGDFHAAVTVVKGQFITVALFKEL